MVIFLSTFIGSCVYNVTVTHTDEESPLLKQVDQRTFWLQACFLVALTILVYSPAFHGGFIFDDVGHLVDDRRLRTLAGLMKIWLYPTQDYIHQYYPLTSSTFWLIHRLWGFETLAYHLVNVAFHICNAMLLWRLLSQLKVPGSYWGAMLFAVHPINVQSVAWIIELKNVQSCFFYLACACTFVHFVLNRGKASWGWYALALLLFVGALLSKAATSSLPLGLVLILFWKRRPTFWRDFVLLIPFALMGSVFAGYVKNLEENYSGFGIDLGLNMLDRWALLGQTLWFYASKMVLPIDLRFVYSRWALDGTQVMQWLPNLGLVLAVAVLVKMRRRWGWGPVTGLLYFIAAVGPLAFVSVAYMRYSYVANHWVYWASMGFLTLMATALVQICTQPKLRLVVMLVVVVGLGARSWCHAHIYQTPIMTWEHVLDANPTEAMAHLNLANAIRHENQAASFKHYQLALMYNPYSFRSMFGLGTLYLTNGDAALCRFYTTQALFYYPTNPFFQYQNARAKIVLGQVRDGQAVLEKVLVRNPDQFESIVLLAHVYLIEDRVDDAAKLAERAEAIDPDDQQTLGIIGMVQARRGQYEQAKRNLLDAIIKNPKFNDGLLTLAIINHQEGNLGIARMYYQRVLTLDANSVAANEKLGLLAWEEGKWEEALTHCRKAFELDPTRTLAARRAADALAHLGKFDEALALFNELHKQTPESPQLLNELAWLLAIRGDAQCLPLAMKVARMTDHKVAVVLDTLGASYAVTGDFAKAIDWAQQAIAITQASGEVQLQAGIKARLSLYQQGKYQTHYTR